MVGHTPIFLTPSLLEQGSAEDFNNSGRTVKLTFSPRDDSLAVFPANNADPQLLKVNRPSSQPIYFALDRNPPLSERRTFISDVSIIFAAVQHLTAQSRPKELGLDDEFLQKLRKLSIDYGNFCKECWAYCSRELPPPEPFQYDADHYRQLATCWSLFTVLYLPESGMDDAPVGDDLMEWLNIHYVGPTTEEGDHLSSLDHPWEDENFWPYLTRATFRGLSKASAFFLGVLSNHPSSNLQRIAKHLAPLLTNHPRLHQFNAERDFAIASRRWKDKVKTLRIELDRISEDDRDDGFDNWWDRLSDIVGILEGRQEVLKRVCNDLGADWKEVCIAWSIFVDPRIRRQELPEVVADVLDELPSDPTNLEDVIHSSLFLGKPQQALSQAYQLDPWLSAHMSDVMESLDLIDRELMDSGLTLRQWYILSYAEYLHTDPGLWRLTVDYMCSCGDVGKEMADEVLIRVPLQLVHQSSKAQGADTTDVGDTPAYLSALEGVLKDVNTSCYEHQREGARRVVCKIAAKRFLIQKEYGAAVAYCTSAEDWPGLGRIVDCVLDEYFTQGPADFARLVANIAPSLETLRAQQESISSGVFVYRLMFAVRLAEFHQRRLNGELAEAAFDIVSMLRDDVAPKAWWAVVLFDAVELLQNEDMLFSTEGARLLLRKLEEICSRSAQGAGSDYLSVLARTTKTKDEKQALQRLQVVRLALAKYYARCGVIGVGGRVESNALY